MNDLCNRGHTATAAINLINEVYGESDTISNILAKIRKDKGRNPRFNVTVN